jgi:Uma2 family endonuclease
VVEVLSPNNDPSDLTERLYAYQSLPSIEMILFVDHRQRHVTVHRRTADGWAQSRTGEGARQLTDQLTIDWSQVWADVDAEASTD